MSESTILDGHGAQCRLQKQNSSHSQDLNASSPQNAESDPVLHACSYCGVKFRRVAHLKRHEDSLHTSDSPKRYGCTACGKDLSRRDVLIRHYQTCPAIKSNTTLSHKSHKRVSRACDSCHALKLRCSGDPVCSKCVELGVECVMRHRSQPARGQRDSTNPWPPPTTDLSQGGYDLSPNENNSNIYNSPEETKNLQILSEICSEAGAAVSPLHERIRVQRHWAAGIETPAPIPKKRGRYVRVACLNCKNQKVKCSGEEVCARCRSHGVECIYNRQRTRRKMTDTRDHDEDNDTVLSPVAFTKLLERIERLEHDRSVFKVHRSQFANDRDKTSKWLEDDGNESDSSTGTVLSISSIGTNENGFQHAASNLFEPISILNRTVVGDEDGKAQELEQLNSPEQSTSSIQPQVAWLSLTRRGNKGIKTLTKETRNDEPALRQAVDQYFFRINPACPCLNENRFRDQLDAFFMDNTESDALRGGDRYQFAALLNLISAEAKLVGDDCIESGPGIVPGWEQFCRAEAILNQIVWLGNGNIWTVECLLVKARYLLALERADSAYAAICQVVRLCIQLGLNNQDSWKACQPFELVMRQRLFWSIYSLERNIALNCGSPYLIRESEIKVDLPPDLDDRLMFRGQPLPKETPKHSPSPYLKAISQWGKLSDEIWDKIFSLSAAKPTSRELIAALDARIVYVVSELPEFFQHSGDVATMEKASKDTPWYIINQNMVLHLKFNQLRLLLRQESMLSFKYNSKTAEECAKIAASSINAIQLHYHSTLYHPVARWASILFLVGAILPLVCIICKKENVQQVREDSIDAFKRGVAILNHMYPTSANARHALRRIQRIIASAARSIREFSRPELEVVDVNANEHGPDALGSELPDFFNYDPWFHSSIDMADQQLHIDESLPFNFNIGAESDFQDGAEGGIDMGRIESMLDDYEMLF